MALNLSGKYWQISELEKEFAVPAYKLYPILNTLNGVIKIGYSYLIPDSLKPVLKNELEKKKHYTITTTSRLLGSHPQFVRLLIANGLPCIIKGIDEPQIEKDIIPIIKKAFDEVRNKKTENDNKENGKTGLAMEVVKLVKKYMEQKRSM